MTFELEYLLLVFLSCCGVVQVATAYGDLKGMLLFGNRLFSFMLGVGLMSGSLLWFFWDGGRNVPDTNGGIAGASQFGLFVLGAFLALLVTFLVTSLINSNLRKGPYRDTVNGLPSLRETTYFPALWNNLGMLWKLYRKRTKKYSSG